MNRHEQKTRKPNPYDSANVFSKYFYFWMRDFFKIGTTRPINEDDLYKPLVSHKSSNLSKEFNQQWNDGVKRGNPSLLKILIKAYASRVLILGFIFSIIDSTAKILQPLCLGGLIDYFTPDQTEIPELHGYLYATGLILCSLVSITLFHPFTLYLFKVAIKIRLACCSLIYSKILRIKESSIEDGLSGQVINLMSSDVYKFDWALSFLNDLWAGPLQTIVIGYFLYQEVGISGIIGMIFLLAFIPLQAWLGKKSASIRYKIAEKTDERVHFMNEIVRAIQVIKMYTWETFFENLVKKLRKDEINEIQGSANISATLLSFEIITRLSIFLCLISYVYMGNTITARKVFIVVAFFNVLNNSMVKFWPLAVTCVAEGYTSVRRIQNFLLKAEQHDHENIRKEQPITKVNDIARPDGKTIGMKGVWAKWNHSEEKAYNGLENVSLDFYKGTLYAVIGQVGSGKSSLLQAFLQELHIDVGEMTINGTISYASQDPWLFEATIRENIIFVDQFDENRYNAVVHCCALERDFQLLPLGDKTIVGERGISLSGGQKARINLARAVYHRADIYLLDDILSAVDSHVGKFIFEQCIKEFLKDHTTILVTHQLQHLRNENNIIVMDNGRVKSFGSFHDLNSENDDKIFAHIDIVDDEKDTDEQINTTEEKKLLTDAVKPNGEEATQNKESFNIGSVNKNIYAAYIKAANSFFMVTIAFILFILAQATKSGVDFFVSIWVTWEEMDEVRQNEDLPANTDDDFWTRDIHVYIYSGIMLLLIYATVHRSFLFYSICLKASKNLHDKLFNGVTRTIMLFFNQNTSGRILNRFSKDIGSIDTTLPSVLVDCIIFFLELIGILVVISILNYWLLIPTIVMFFIFYGLRHIFLNTARNIKRVEAITRSPVFSHTNATLQGLPTVRALKAEQLLKAEFDEHQDLNTTASFLFLTTTRGFAFWLDAVCLVYISIVIFSFFVLGNDVVGGNVGLAVTQVISMIGMCNWGLRQTAELENQMTSVERIVEYTKLKPETQFDAKKFLKSKVDWPQLGGIKFINLSLSYTGDFTRVDDLVLKKLNIEFAPREKIGVVGRTGAGKSSIIQALFRLTYIDGIIEIDNVDTSTIGLHSLRNKISIIPQDPILFSGTLRQNLDPYENIADDKLWDALEKVELKTTITTLAYGLNTKVSDGGVNFSMGQRQLICLARAILRNNKILVLDEATASVDQETDNLIQNTISTHFKDCTIITIAHRLNTVMECDKILVMDAGRVKEFDHPYMLLQQKDGHFYHLVEQTGKDNFTALVEIAKKTWDRK